MSTTPANAKNPALGVLPGAEPFSIEAPGATGQTGVLLLHGFTASPQALRELAGRLQEAGFSSVAPLLPGHGTTVKELNRTSWDQIEAAAVEALKSAAARFEKVVIMGESSGGAVALRLAALHPELVDGVVTAGGSLVFPQDRIVRATTPLYRWIRPEQRKLHVADVKDRQALQTRVAYEYIPMHAFHGLLRYNKLVKRDCPLVKAPLLVLQALHDHAVSPKSADFICDSAGSTYKRVVWYPESYHVILIDLEKEQVFRDIVEFVKGVDAGTLDAGAKPA